MKRRQALKLLGGLAGATWAVTGMAQQSGSFPSRVVRVIVPYPPGGVTDLNGRLASDILAEYYGKPVVVENKGGGNGVVAQQFILQAPRDGHLLLSGGLGGLILPPILAPDLPISPQANFIPVAQIAEFVNVLVVGRDIKARNVKELIDYARSRPAGELNYGTNGAGTSGHFTSEYFNLKVGLKITHIPYRSSNDIIVGLRNGDLQMAFLNAPAAAALIKAGTLRAIAVTRDKRIQMLPDVPTVQESGLPDFNVTSWVGIYAPTNTPMALVNELSTIIVDGVKLPKNSQRLLSAGFEPAPKGQAEFAAFNKAELDRWRDVATRANIVVSKAA